MVTHFDLLKQSYQSVIEFHNKRGNAENSIREEKYGYDLKHFPCLKLRANHAFGFIAMVAHNLLRWACMVLVYQNMTEGPGDELTFINSTHHQGSEIRILGKYS